MQLTPDLSFFAQVLTFVVLWMALKRLIFDPMGRTLDLRAERIVAAEAHAQHLTAEAAAARGDYEHAVRELRADMARTAAAARSAAQEEQARTLAEARVRAAEDIAGIRGAIAEQVESARRTLSADAERIAAEMLARVGAGVRA